MNKYTEIIDRIYEKSGNRYIYKDIEFFDKTIKIKKVLKIAQNISIQYFLPIENDVNLYYDFINYFSELLNIKDMKIVEYEEEDEISNSNYTCVMQNLNRDKIEIFTVGLTGSVQVLIEGEEIEKNEKYYDNNIIQSLERVYEKIPSNGMRR